MHHGGSEGVAVCCAKARRTHGTTEAHGGSTTAQKMRRPRVVLRHIAPFSKSGIMRFRRQSHLYCQALPLPQNCALPAEPYLSRKPHVSAEPYLFRKPCLFRKPYLSPSRALPRKRILLAHPGMPFFLPPSLTPGGGGDIINYSSGANRLFGGML